MSGGLAVGKGVFAHERRFRFEDRTSEPFHTAAAMLQGSKMPAQLLRLVIQDAMCNIFSVYFEVRVKVFVGDIKLY